MTRTSWTTKPAKALTCATIEEALRSGTKLHERIQRLALAKLEREAAKIAAEGRTPAIN